MKNNNFTPYGIDGRMIEQLMRRSSSAALNFHGYQVIIYFLLSFVFLLITTLCQAQKGHGEVTRDDNSYEKGGKLKITYDTTKGSDGYTQVDRQYTYFDAKGFIREKTDTITNDRSEYYLSVIHYYAEKLNNGDIVRRETLLKRDDLGNEVYFNEEKYIKKADGEWKQTSGYIREDGKLTKKYNDKTGAYDKVDGVSLEDNNKSCCYQRNEIALFGDYLHVGDNYNPFNAIGESIAVTRFIGPNLGVTVDAGIYKHHESLGELNLNLSELNVTAGATYIPIGRECCRNKFILPLHALFGVSSYTQKISYEGGGNARTLHAFTMNVGATAQWKVSDQLHILLPEVDYAPTFFGGKIQHNYRLGIGASVNFGKKICSSSKRSDGALTNEPLLKPELFANISAYDFDKKPKLYNPGEDQSDPKLNNPHRTEGKNCVGKDVFDYYNNQKTGVDATLVVKNEGSCRVHVVIAKVKNRPGLEKGKDTNEGDTKDKDQDEKTQKINGNDVVRTLFEYDVDKMPGSDVRSFRIEKGLFIRVTITCGGGNGDCSFTRNFAVTSGDPIPTKSDNDAPRLDVDPPSPVQKIDQYNNMGNRCMSKDVVFYKIVNKDAKAVMTVHLKAVSECGCYFEAYTDQSPNQPAGQPMPLEGGALGLERNDESPKIAKPAQKGKTNEGKEELSQEVPPGKTIYVKGRCPLQQPEAGPCKGHVEITGITYTIKKK